MRCKICLLLLAGTITLIGTGTVARGDVLLLKQGGELRGELLPASVSAKGPASTKARKVDDANVTIRTLNGAVVTVARDTVESQIRRRPLLEEYETIRRNTADTVDAQWQLAEWCRSKALSRERAVHLQRVVGLDPEHVAAHRALGHTKHEGSWTTTEALMTSRGYVKHKGKYVLPQELELIQADERENESEKAWFKRIKMWSGWLDSDRGERQAEAAQELSAIRDGDAVPALARTFRDDPNEQKRLLYVEVMTRIEGTKPLKPLLEQSLKDESQLVRTAAVRGVRETDVDAAVPIYIRALRNEANVMVNRAATALSQMGDDTVIPALIEALVTRHRYRVMVPDQTMSVTSDGSMANPNAVAIPPDVAGMLATGQLPYGVQVQTNGPPVRMKRVTVQKDEQNPSVLTALNLLTGENFGYDEQAWRNWQKAKTSGTLKPKKKPSSKVSPQKAKPVT